MHRLGDVVDVRLVEAAPVAGALRFELLSEGQAARPRGSRPRKARARRRSRSQARQGDRPVRKATQGQAGPQVRARSQQARSSAKTGNVEERQVMESHEHAPTDDLDAGNTARPKSATSGTAMKRGFRGRCPRCGEGKLFRAFLKVDDTARPAGWTSRRIAPTTCRPISSSSSSAISWCRWRCGSRPIIRRRSRCSSRSICR